MKRTRHSHGSKDRRLGDCRVELGGTANHAPVDALSASRLKEQRQMASADEAPHKSSALSSAPRWVGRMSNAGEYVTGMELCLCGRSKTGEPLAVGLQNDGRGCAMARCLGLAQHGDLCQTVSAPCQSQSPSLGHSSSFTRNLVRFPLWPVVLDAPRNSLRHPRC